MPQRVSRLLSMSFAFVIGHCFWLPPFPKALAVLAYFYGLGDLGRLPSVYEAVIEQQLVSAGETAE